MKIGLLTTRILLIMSYTLAILISSCNPDPIEIDLPATKALPVITTQQISERELIVCLTRTFLPTDAVKPILIDSNRVSIPKELLIKHARVQIKSAKHYGELIEISDGVYSIRDFPIIPGISYQLIVELDGTSETSQAIYTALPKAQLDMARIQATDNPDIRKLSYSFLAESGYYLVQYYTKQSANRVPFTQLNLETITKQLLEQNLNFDLFSASNANSGRILIHKEIKKEQGDSVLIALTRIDESFFNYLMQLKQARSLINQLKGEIIPLKGNFTPGFGYFTLGIPDFRLVYL